MKSYFSLASAISFMPVLNSCSMIAVIFVDIINHIVIVILFSIADLVVVVVFSTTVHIISIVFLIRCSPFVRMAAFSSPVAEDASSFLFFPCRAGLSTSMSKLLLDTDLISGLDYDENRPLVCWRDFRKLARFLWVVGLSVYLSTERELAGCEI